MYDTILELLPAYAWYGKTFANLQMIYVNKIKSKK